MSYKTGRNTGHEKLKFCGSRKHVIAIDAIDCCLACVKRGKRKPKRSWKYFRKTKYKCKDV